MIRVRLSQGCLRETLSDLAAAVGGALARLRASSPQGPKVITIIVIIIIRATGPSKHSQMPLAKTIFLQLGPGQREIEMIERDVCDICRAALGALLVAGAAPLARCLRSLRSSPGRSDGAGCSPWGPWRADVLCWLFWLLAEFASLRSSPVFFAYETWVLKAARRGEPH